MAQGEPSGASSVSRMAKRVLGFAVVETGAAMAFFVHGLLPLDTTGPHHAVAPVLLFLLLLGAALALTVRVRAVSSRLALVWAAAMHSVAVASLYLRPVSEHLQQALSGLSSPELAERVFMPASVVPPNNGLLHLTGAVALITAVGVAVHITLLWRVLDDPGSRPGSSAPPVSDANLRPPSSLSGSAGPMRMLALAWRMLMDTPFKSLGTLIGVIVSVFLMTQQTSLLTGILGRVTSFVNSTGADIWIVSQATESTDATGAIPASYVGVAAGTPGAQWAAPVVQGIGRVIRPDGVQEFVKVLGVEAPRYAGLPTTLAPGTEVDSLRASGRLLINWNDRPVFAGAEIGDRIEIGGQHAIIGGFFQGMDPHSPYYYVYANIDDARGLTRFPQDRVSFIAVGVQEGEDPADVRAALQSRLPNALVKTKDELSAMEEHYFLARTPVGVVFGMGATVAAFIGAAIVAVTMYSTAIDRARDFGTLKAIGARKRDLLQLLLLQALLFSAVGYALGMGAFLLVRYHVPQLPLVLPPKIAIGVFFAAVASCVLACFAAIRRVLSLDPAIVFRS